MPQQGRIPFHKCVRHLLGAVLFLAAAPLGAQTAGALTGTVVDAVTGAPISGATVRASGTSQGVASRADGTYRLPLAPGSYEIVANRVGFGPVRERVAIAAGQTVTRNFRLVEAVTALDGIVAVGSRRPDRTATETPVPVDIVTSAEIAVTGLTETNQILQRLAPSFNFPRATIADGTDVVRPATLRGLAPDQVLVLVNGKRRHPSALVNVNGTVGRGSTSVDLNAIPANAIERIEVLREGAAAQYGSDAIAGVINVVLKSGVERSVLGTLGQTREGDGEVVHAAGTAGFDIGANGTFTATAEFRDRGFTNRTREDPRQQFFAGDAREATANRLNHRQGDAAVRDYGAFFNTAYDVNPGTAELYAFGGLTQREGESAGFFRRPNDARTVRAIHPNGFLPLIATEILDGSAALGVRGMLAGFRYDLSGVYGRNSFDFNVRNSNNVSLGAASPTSFYAGTLEFDQFTTNLDLVRTFNVGMVEPLSVAFGAEFRRDGYGIVAGDSASWINGRVRVLDGPSAGSIAAVGAQVFPGFRPSDEKDVSRSNVAGYLDVEFTPVRPVLLTFAARAESYSDFGSTVDGRVAARWELREGLSFRGSVGTGFRAPSLQQQYFSSTATNFIGGQPFDIRTFPVESPEAQVLGATPLRPEESVNYSIGMAVRPLRDLSLTVDAYRIDIDDRIIFSENFTGTRIQNLFIERGFAGVTGGRFFTNAIDTRTEGVDVVAQYAHRWGTRSVLRFTGGLNVTETEVLTDSVVTPMQLAGLSETLFGRIERVRIERGQPRSNVNLAFNYDWQPLDLYLNFHRYGEVESANPTPAANIPAELREVDQVFGAKWVTDVSVGYAFFDRLTLRVGADNVFDVYPDENSNRGSVPLNFGGNANFGIFPYSGISPFGFNGAYYYVRLAYRL